MAGKLNPPESHSLFTITHTKWMMALVVLVVFGDFSFIKGNIIIQSLTSLSASYLISSSSHQVAVRLRSFKTARTVRVSFTISAAAAAIIISHSRHNLHLIELLFFFSFSALLLLLHSFLLPIKSVYIIS